MRKDHRDRSSEHLSALKQYDAVVAFVRWLEARDTISSSDAQRLLDTDKPVYLEYLKTKLPAGMKHASALDLPKMTAAVSAIKQHIVDSYPELADQVKLLDSGRSQSA